jgi:hypothetical protein
MHGDRFALRLESESENQLGRFVMVLYDNKIETLRG